MSDTDWYDGGWMMTFSGRKFYPTRARPEDIDIRDIAHALAHICRYNGHCRSFYSVAEHCIRVAAILPAHLKLNGLLHDAAEAYVGDMIRPIKHTAPMEPYRALEKIVQAAIVKRFGLIPGEIPAIKEADNILLTTERRDLSTHPLPWPEGPEPLKATIIPLEMPAEAERFYLSLFVEFGGVI